jgi:hypothetical protein
MLNKPISDLLESLQGNIEDVPNIIKQLYGNIFIFQLKIIVQNITEWRAGYCRYPEDRVPLQTISKSRQGAGHASMRYHVSCSFGAHLLQRWLQSCHVSRGPGPCILTEVSSGAATCPSASSLASLLRWAPALPCVPGLRALPSWEGSSGATTCPTARGSAFLRGELWCCHVSHDPRQAVDHRNKEMLSCPRHAVRLACF